MLNDKGIKSCVPRFDSGAYSRLQFMRAVRHSVGAHMEALQLRDDSSSSEDEDEASPAPVRAIPAATTSASSESATLAATSTSDDYCEVCLVAPRAGFTPVPCGHALFCESCAMRVSDMTAGCPVCRADITMVMREKIVHSVIWCRVVRDVHPCYLVSRCPVSQCQSPQF